MGSTWQTKKMAKKCVAFSEARYLGQFPVIKMHVILECYCLPIETNIT